MISDSDLLFGPPCKSLSTLQVHTLSRVRAGAEGHKNATTELRRVICELPKLVINLYE